MWRVRKALPHTYLSPKSKGALSPCVGFLPLGDCEGVRGNGRGFGRDGMRGTGRAQHNPHGDKQRPNLFPPLGAREGTGEGAGGWLGWQDADG